MKKLLIVLLLIGVLFIGGCITDEPEKETTTTIKNKIYESTLPEDTYPSKVEGVIREIDLSQINPTNSEECLNYIKEPNKTICYLISAIRNKDKELCSFVKNYSIEESVCIGFGAGHGGCGDKYFNWTLNKQRCESLVDGEKYTCNSYEVLHPGEYGKCKYDQIQTIARNP